MWAEPLKKSTAHHPGKHNGTGATRIFTKLKIGTPGDKYEQEADQVADTVMRMSDSAMSPPHGTGRALQMQSIEEEEEEALQMQPIEEEEEALQMQPIEEEGEEEMLQPKCKECEEQESLQMKSKSSSTFQKNTSTPFTSKLKQSSSGGRRLPSHVNNEMSQKIGADFSNVTIHNDKDSHYLNDQIGARAFTHGTNIFFNKGEYNLTSHSSKHLLAHELTHVVQQTGSKSKSPNIQRTIEGQFRVQWRNKIDSEIKDRGNAYAIAIASGISLASMPSRFDNSVNTFLDELQTNLGKYALGKLLENVPGGGAINAITDSMIAARERIEAHTIQAAFAGFKNNTRAVLLAGVDSMTDSGEQFNQQIQNTIMSQADQDPRFSDPPSAVEDADQYTSRMQLFVQQEVNRHMFGNPNTDFSDLIADVNNFIERSFQYFILARAEVLSEYRACYGRMATEGSACDEGVWAWERYPRVCRHQHCEQWLTYSPMPPDWTGPQPRQENLGMCMNQPCTWFTVSSGVEHPAGHANVRESVLERERQRFTTE